MVRRRRAVLVTGVHVIAFQRESSPTFSASLPSEHPRRESRDQRTPKRPCRPRPRTRPNRNGFLAGHSARPASRSAHPRRPRRWLPLSFLRIFGLATDTTIADTATMCGGGQEIQYCRRQAGRGVSWREAHDPGHAEAQGYAERDDHADAEP